MSSVGNAMLYGYSNTRIRAMLSRMVGKSAISEMYDAPNVSAIIGTLLQTEYRKYLDQFGGESIEGHMVDFALNKNFETSVAKLVDISPRKMKLIIEPIVSRGDYLNIKLVLRAKAKNMNFDSIAKYITASKRLDAQTMRSALEEQGVDGAARRLMKSSYAKEIAHALEEYNKSGKMTELEATIDKSMFNELAAVIQKIKKVNKNAAMLVMLEMEMRNILTLMRGKRGLMDTEELKKNLFSGGFTSVKNLIALYESSKGPLEIAKSVTRFKLTDIAENSNEKEILPYEIAMRKIMLEKARSAMRRSVLSFAVIVAFYYIKEMEISSLRSVINGRIYNLGKEEIDKMVVWQ